MALPRGTKELIAVAFAEDLGPRGDVTSRALLPENRRLRARIVTRESGVLAGVEVAAQVFRQLDPKIRAKILKKDGAKIRKGDAVLEVNGPAISVLAAERTALNFIRHLSGVATLTDQFVRKCRGTRAEIYDTRKTTPALRRLEKYAVRCGGGRNHRMGLWDMVLIKDNHVAAAGSVAEAVRRARAEAPRGTLVQVECDTLAQVDEALGAGPDLILCDNMTPAQLKKAVAEVRGKIPVEASGGVDLKTVAAIARTGVDRISVGAITHSARQVDLALDVAKERPHPRRSPASPRAPLASGPGRAAKKKRRPF